MFVTGLTAFAGPDQPQTPAEAQKLDAVRQDCIEHRRRICGKIIQIQTNGLVIDSGYTNLNRAPLNRSWLISGSAAGTKTTSVVEENKPGAFCFGLVFLTDLPKSPGPKPKLYDYVNLEAFPQGHSEYTSVGTVKRTVRRYTTKLIKAVQWAVQ